MFGFVSDGKRRRKVKRERLSGVSVLTNDDGDILYINRRRVRKERRRLRKMGWKETVSYLISSEWCEREGWEQVTGKRRRKFTKDPGSIVFVRALQDEETGGISADVLIAGDSGIRLVHRSMERALAPVGKASYRMAYEEELYNDEALIAMGELVFLLVKRTGGR